MSPRPLLSIVLATSIVACSMGDPATDLRTLVTQDSTYYHPETMEPFSGRVFRSFPGDSTKNEIEGVLLAGTWHGELIVYHPSGRVRYMGSFLYGERCGPWTENQDDVDQVTDFRRVLSDIESMAIYPPCEPE